MSFINEITKKIGQIGDIAKETYGPLSSLETSYLDYIGSDLRYPLEVGNPERYPHTVMFQTWIPKTSTIVESATGDTQSDRIRQRMEARLNPSVGKRLIGALTGTAKSVLKNVTTDVPTEAYPGSDMRVNRNQQYNSRMFDFNRRAEPSDLITLYSPVSWMDRHNNAYNEQSMTAAFGAAGAVIEAASSIADAYKSDVDWRTNLGNLLNKAGEVANGPAGVEGIGAVLGGLGMDGNVIRDAGLTALGYAMNPQFEMLYGGTNLREFQFDFTLTPRNYKEAETIRKIIKAFKYHASPQYVTGQGRYIIPPSYFDITFMFNGRESEWLPTVSTCVLKTIDVDYSGGLDTWATHADGSPIQTKMTLVFAELEMMHKKLRKLGY